MKEMDKGRVFRVLIRNGHTNADAVKIIDELETEGLLRDAIESKEWVERQEEERRAWAVNTAVEYARGRQGVRVNLVGLARDIEEFVIGPEKEDPDLHDQDALDQFFVLYAEDAAAGIEFMSECFVQDEEKRQYVPFEGPTDEQVNQAAENLLDKMSKAGVRLKNGEKFERLLNEG